MRISVVGCSGSGKTTTAQAIAAALGVPHLELDSVFHQPNWTPLPTEEFQTRVRSYCQQTSWVIDGNYGSRGILDIVWTHADTVVWLDPPRSVVMWQVVSRSLRRGFSGTLLWNGNRERLSNLLKLDPNDNIVLWAATRFDRTRRTYLARTSDPAWSQLRVFRLRSARERQEFIAGLTRDERADGTLAVSR